MARFAGLLALAALPATTSLAPRAGPSFRRRAVPRASATARTLKDEYDLAVLGAGVTGVTAATKAAQLGMRVIVVDDPGGGAKIQVGGPSGLFSKALRDVSKRLDVRTLRSMGMQDHAIWAQARSLTTEIALVETQTTVRRLQRNGVMRIQGKARFAGRRESDGAVLLACRMRDGSDLEVVAQRALVATGSRAWPQPGIPLDGRRVFDSDSVNKLSYLPKSVVITGSGIIAIEFARIFAALAAQVTLLVRGPSLGRCLERFGMDGAFAEDVQASLEGCGIAIRFETEVVPDSFFVPQSLSAPLSLDVRTSPKGGRPRTETLECDAYMLAAGRDACTAGLDLEAVGAGTDKKGNLVVDGRLRTACDRVYGAGDVLGPPSLASTGTEQAVAAVGHMYGGEGPSEGSRAEAEGPQGGELTPAALLGSPYRYPVGIWTMPEMAYYGTSPKAAEAAGVRVFVGEAAYADTLRGHVNRCKVGKLRMTVAAEGGQVLGVFIFGDEACELVHYGMELVVGGRTVQDIRNTMFAAVTFHELFKLAAEDAIERMAAVGAPS